MKDDNIPFVEKLGRLVLFPLSFGERAAAKAKAIAEERQAAHDSARRQEREEEMRIEREDRERRDKEEALKAQEDERAAKLVRDDILFQVRLLYDRHAADISQMLPQEKFERYFKDYFPPDCSVETLTHRSEELKKMILSFFAEEESEASLNTIEDVLAEAERRKNSISSYPMDGDELESVLSLVEKWKTRQIRKLVEK
ncbi:hypothetical protein LF1_11050 [Rubripirellula obstinata]|uniref:Uncharacterized protein n=1 Tax=Rubripirellula obstinata TaxID=406547 RepID=A0A5B1CGC6_9BACT|nr:hypothetical protein [Rubripirellula obstinata]KAA1258583.1 hypothetical protein LF1_11050 [Rubripirellula obstinata]